MAEFDRAKVRSHMCRGPFRFINDLPAANNKVITGTQQAVKTPITMASVQATRISMCGEGSTETARARSRFLFRLWMSKNTIIKRYEKMTTK